jgi:hypothetical protein
MFNLGAKGSEVKSLRRMTFGAALLVVVQIAVGIAVNLYVSVPKHHPGSRPSDYIAGSFNSVIWALGHGAIGLSIHSALGLALVVMAISVAVRAAKLRAGSVAITSILGALLVIGAGFNGASFLDFGGQNISSLVMALLALGALCCYIYGVYVLSPASRAGEIPSGRAEYSQHSR